MRIRMECRYRVAGRQAMRKVSVSKEIWNKLLPNNMEAYLASQIPCREENFISYRILE